MALRRTGEVFLVTAIDVLAGLISSGIIEAVSPPITDQGPLRLYAEGVLQLGAIIVAGSEISALVHPQSVRSDPTKQVAFYTAMFLGMPSTIAKISTLGAWGRGQVRKFLEGVSDSPQSLSQNVSTSANPSTPQPPQTN